MKLKKKILSLLTLFAFTFLFCLPVYATPVNDIKAYLENLGVPESQCGNIIEYLQKVNISDSNYQSILAKIDSTVLLLKGSKDITSLDITTETQIEKNMTEAFSILGLSATFSSGSDGNIIINVKDSSGTSMLSMDSQGTNDFLTNFDGNVLKTTITSARQFSNNADKGKFDPVSGIMKATATNNGNYILLGISLIIISSIWILRSAVTKRQKI
ncbi:MAG: hypothetical protein H7Y18_01840 [Clostridiaceae bacterium]|nr:hypothetical protein [Clostridiaceae bacterium]